MRMLQVFFFFNLNSNLNVNVQFTVLYNVDFLLRSRRYVYCYVGGGQGSGTHVPDWSYPAKSPKTTQVPARITTVFKKIAFLKKISLFSQLKHCTLQSWPRQRNQY